ncbi:MAG: acetyl-coenzyme A synthetase, partial [Proteobacteria bacterium]|nr:acetyl-coenzyme A synthetase [Pseudomonadota bacterium]
MAVKKTSGKKSSDKKTSGKKTSGKRSGRATAPKASVASSSDLNGNISSALKETRIFPPPREFAKHAHVKSPAQYQKLWEQSVKKPEVFWGKQAKEQLDWIKPFTKVLQWKAPFAKWFSGGKLNASANCIDRHVAAGKGNKAALIWEGEPGDSRTLTYQDLLRETSKCANALKAMGVKAGDRVAIYMPLIPETVIAMLACARVGAMHCVVFGGFSSEALADRINDCGASVVITAEPYAADSEHPLFLLYTSGSTGKPKGILHTTAGYLLGAALSAKLVFDLKDSDTFWCTADAGWVTGHTYLAYGPLANGATIVMYEGAPNHPDWGRLWSIIEKYRVSILYTAPTAIRACLRAGDSWPEKHDLSSLRLLGSVGEPINPEAWMWYHEVIGGGRCPIVDTWWQTETGGIMISPLPGAIPQVPGSATKPFFGIMPDIVDKNGKPVPAGSGGFLVIRKPWPSMLRTIWGDDERYKQQYWSQVPGIYFTGDGARRDKKG